MYIEGKLTYGEKQERRRKSAQQTRRWDSNPRPFKNQLFFEWMFQVIIDKNHSSGFTTTALFDDHLISCKSLLFSGLPEDLPIEASTLIEWTPARNGVKEELVSQPTDDENGNLGPLIFSSIIY